MNTSKLESLEARLQRVRMEQEANTRQLLDRIRESYPIEEYCHEKGVSFTSLGWNLSVHLGVLPREKGSVREKIVEHLREIRKLVGTPLKNVGSEISYNHWNAKRDHLIGGELSTVHVYYDTYLEPGDKCQIVEEEEGDDYDPDCRPTRRYLVCKRGNDS